ncbi:MAG: ParB N-terminal domain-containing protein [Catenulispora sp.]|nr:ParB N-terminal domain-containing protein [Catenulispora sp.]
MPDAASCAGDRNDSTPGPTDGPAVRVRVAELRGSVSLRRDGLDGGHVRRLMEVFERLPPITVHRETMRVIDGLHRLEAARLDGREEIDAVFFRGSLDNAFCVGVKANVAHGLPLSLADRKAAAQRIIGSHPHLSDRSIGLITSLSHRTVAAVRRDAGPGSEPEARVGLDGHTRPIDIAEGRRRAHELILARPGASVREIAAYAGISTGTAHDVRKRLERGEDPVHLGRKLSDPAGSAPARCRTTAPEPAVRAEPEPVPTTRDLLHRLAQDPALRYSDQGRGLLVWLRAHAAGVEEWADLIDVVPEHRMAGLVLLSEQCAEAWRRFAEELTHRGQAA